MARQTVLIGLLPVSTILFLIGEMLRVNADTMVTGMVFCDQCKDGERSFFDYPLYGAKVAIECGGGITSEDDTTNWFGNYAVRFDGSADLNGCTARVVDAPDQCGSGFGPPQELTLMFRFFGTAVYSADPLLAQPRVPMSFCREYEKPSPSPLATSPPPPLVISYPPPPPLIVSHPPPSTPRPPQVSPTSHPPPSPPSVILPPQLPRPPQVPPTPFVPPLISPPSTTPRTRQPPIFPFMQASACPYDKWLMPQFQCYWRMVTPNTSVALAFGPVAATRYGIDMTLWDGLQGRGDAYRTLLREATTSLLNSYNSLRFVYTTIRVIGEMNAALLGSKPQALRIALRFRRANSGQLGSERLNCDFTPCN